MLESDGLKTDILLGTGVGYACACMYLLGCYSILNFGRG